VCHFTVPNASQTSRRVTTHVDTLPAPGNPNLCEITDQIDSSGCSWKKAEG